MATIGTALAVVVMVWAAGALLSGSGGDSMSNAANRQTITLTSNPQSNPPPTGRLVPAWASSSSSAPSSAVTTTTTTPPPPPPPGPCPDSALKVTVTVGQPGYRVGQHPEFTLHLTNAGPVPCFRDVSRPLRYLVLAAAGSPVPLWTSVDCYTAPTHEVPLLAPGQESRSSVVWAGRTSAPGCPLSRKIVPAGMYTITGHLGPLAGPPTTFSLQG